MDDHLRKLAESNGLSTTGTYQWPEGVDEDLKKFVLSPEAGAFFVVEEPDGLVIGPPPRNSEPVRTLVVAKPKGALPEDKWMDFVVVTAMPLASGALFSYLHALLAHTVLKIFDFERIALGSSARHKIVEAERALEQLSRHTEIAFVDLETGALADTAQQALDALKNSKNAEDHVPILNELQSVVNAWKQQVNKLVASDRDVYEGTASDEIGFWIALESALRSVESQLASPFVQKIWSVLESHKRFHATRDFVSDTGLSAAIKRVESFTQGLFRDIHLGELLAAVSVDQLVNATYDVFGHLNRKLRTSEYPAQRSIGLVEAIGRDFSSVLRKIVQARLEVGLENAEDYGHSSGREARVQYIISELRKIKESVNLAGESWDAVAREFATTVRDLMRKRAERFMVVKIRSSHLDLINRVNAIGQLAEMHGELWPLFNSDTQDGSLLDTTFYNTITQDNILTMDDPSWRSLESQYAVEAQAAEMAIAEKLKQQLKSVDDSSSPDRILEVFTAHRAVLSRPQVRAVTHRFQSTLLESTKQELLGTERASRVLPNGNILERVIRIQHLLLRVAQIRENLSVVIGEEWREHVEASHIGNVCDTIEQSLKPQEDIHQWIQTVSKEEFSDGFVLAVTNGELSVAGNYRETHNVLRNLKALGFRFDISFTNLAESMIETSIARNRISDCLGNVEAASQTLQSYPRIQAIPEISRLSKQVTESILEGINRVSWSSSNLASFVTGFEQASTALESHIQQVAETEFAISELMTQAQNEQENFDIPGFRSRVASLSNSVLSSNYSAAVEIDINQIVIEKINSMLSVWQPSILQVKIEIRNQFIGVVPSLESCLSKWLSELNDLLMPTLKTNESTLSTLESGYSAALSKIWAAWSTAQAEVRQWTAPQALWRLKKDQVLGTLKQSISEDNGSFDTWVKTLNELRKIQSRTTYKGSRISLDTQEAAIMIEAKAETWQDLLLQELAAAVLERSTSLINKCRQSRRELEKGRIDSQGNFLEGLQILNNADESRQLLEHWLPSLTSANKLLRSGPITLPSNWVQSDMLLSESQALNAIVNRRFDDLEKMRPTLLKELESKTATLKVEVDRHAETWRANKPLQANVDPDTALKALSNMLKLLQDTSADLDRTSKAFQSLRYDSPLTLLNLLERVEHWTSEVESLSLGWSGISSGWKSLNELGNIKFFDTSAEILTKKFADVRSLIEDMPNQSRQMPAFDKLRARLEKSLTSSELSLLTLKGSSAIKSHHIIQLIPGISTKTAENPSLCDLWLNLPPQNIVSDIVESAEGEYRLLKYIESTQTKWDEMLLEGSNGVIRNLGTVLPLLSDHLAAFSAMTGSPYFKAVASVVQDWERKLLAARKIFDLFADVQQQNVYLKGVLTSSAVAAVLPNEARRFKNVSEEFTQLYMVAEAHPALEFTNVPRLTTNLNRLHSQYVTLNKSLSGFLEAQRARFPRLFFVGDEKLLEMVGSPIETWAFKHLPAIFPGVAKIDLENGVVFSPEDEKLPVRVVCTDSSDNIELLVNLQHELSKSLQNIVSLAITQVSDVWNDPIKFCEWLEITPIQSVLCALRVRWSALCIENRVDDCAVDEISLQYEKLLQYIPSAGDESLLWSRRKESIIAELIYEQSNIQPKYPDLLVGLKEKDCRVFVYSGKNQWEYGYEYLGAPEPIVRTTITDDLYLNAVASLAQGKGLSAVGPAGTGKTETVKSLGTLMGRRVVVFNCDDQFDHQTIIRMMNGCAKTKSWACFDEFNRLNKYVLSSVAQHVNENIRSSPVFVTMNPGYSGRTVLPPNMRAQFREFVLAAPEAKEIARVILYSHDMIDPAGAERAVKLLDKMRECASKQGHYDWGLRALKGIIRVAILLGGDIRSACITAIRPKLFTEDVQIFDLEIEKLFVKANDNNAALMLAENCSSANLQVEEKFHGYVQSLEIFRQLFVGTMLLGPSGCGKSTVWKELARINNAEVIVVNPSAIHKSALIGSLDPITREWSDGLLSSLFRRIEENLRGEQFKKWLLVFDGEIEPDWAEALNSLLDDNKRLTLANGEILTLPTQLHIIFETTSLHAATPATVSRCGMICMPDYSPEAESTAKLPTSVAKLSKTIHHAMEFIELQAFDTYKSLNLGSEWLSMAWALAGDSDEAGRLMISDEIRKIAPVDALLPKEGTLTDYYVSELTGRWHLWSDSVVQPKNLEKDAINKPDTLIPTPDTACHEAIIQSAIQSHKPLILVGPPGSGKTMTLYSVLRQITHVSSLIPLNFSSTATYELIIQALELHCEYTTGSDGNKVLSPSGSRWGVLFIDELNLPQPNDNNVVPVLQFIRHLIQYGGFYDSDGCFVTVERIQLVAACNPPPLRRHLPRTLLRHFVSVEVGYPSKSSLEAIYTAFLSAIDPIASQLILPTLNVYRSLSDIAPTETWTPRELTRWTRSIHTSWDAVIESKRTESLLFKIWAYEGERVLCDRLTKDLKQDVLSLIKQNMPSNLALNNNEIWSYFLSQRPKFVESSDLKQFLRARLSLFVEEAAGEGDKNLVVHDEFIHHVSRLDRILRQPQGHTLLVGEAAVGKTTLVRFSCWLVGMSLDILRTHSNYTELDFCQDLRRVLLKAIRKPTCLLLGDELFSRPDFIELMNSLLANGEVPGLFVTHEQIAELEDTARRAGFLGGDIIPWFRNQVVFNLHIIFVTSDISQASPALLNRCVVDRVESWSQAVREEIAQHWCSSTDAPDVIPSLLANSFDCSFVDINHGVTFIESCRQFERSYNALKRGLEDSQRHFVTGTDRIKSAVLEIGQLRNKLAQRQELLTKENKKSSEVLSKMLHEQSEAERKRVAAIEIRAAVQAQSHQIEERQKAANEDLAATEPLITQAAEGVQNIKKVQLNELRAFNNPPDPVKMTLEAVCLILGLRTDGSWKQVLSAVRGDEFISRIVSFDTSQLSPQLINKIEQEYMTLPGFNYERVSRASKACGPLLRWVVAQIAYGRAVAAVQPLMQEINALNEQAKTSRAQLAAIEAMLSDLESAIEKSKKEYSETVAHCETLKADMQRINSQLQRAEHLMESLVGEKERWSSASAEFSDKVIQLPARALLESSDIAYGGELDPLQKSKLHDSIIKALPGASGIVSDLRDEREDADLIVKHSWSVVLVVDPSDSWEPAEQGLNVKKTSFLLDSDTLGKELDTALRFGQHLIIKNAERFDSLILPILMRDFVRKGARLLVRLGSGDIDVSPGFKLTLHARDISSVNKNAPILLPRVNIVDFSVTKTKFEHMIADQLLKAQVPELAERTQNLRRLKFETTEKLKKLEDQLLLALSTPATDKILEDQILVESLEKLKAESTQLNETQSSTAEALVKLEEASHRFEESAKIASATYVRVASLTRLNKFYTVGVDWLCELATRFSGAENFGEKFNLEVTRRVLSVMRQEDWSMFRDVTADLPTLPPATLLEVVKETPATKFILAGLVTDNATDPANLLESGAVDDNGNPLSCSVIPLGSSQACQKADRVLSEAIELGEWVVLQNIEVADDEWLKGLSRLMQTASPNKNFRLILTGRQSSIVEIPELVASGRTISIERERGVKTNISAALTDKSDSVDFSVCYIHSCFAEKFDQIGFSSLDLDAARWFVKEFFDINSQNISQKHWESLKQALLIAVWGGRTGNASIKAMMQLFIDLTIKAESVFPDDFLAWLRHLPNNIDWLPKPLASS